MPKGFSVYLDAGHGEGARGQRDPGAVGPGGTTENAIALAMVQRLAHLFRERGVTVHGDTLGDAVDTESYKEAVTAANKLRVDLFVSIHCNAAADRSARGFEVLYLGKEHWSLATQICRSVAQAVARGGSKWLGGRAIALPIRGAKERNDLYVLTRTEMPAVLVELAFISNQTEEALLRDDSVQQALAQAIADALC